MDYCRPDFMHTCCLGVVQSVCGSIMWELFKDLDGTYHKPRDICANLLAMVKLASKSMRLPEAPFSDLTVGMIRPRLTKKPAMQLKAAEGRIFVPVLCVMLADFSFSDGLWPSEIELFASSGEPL